MTKQTNHLLNKSFPGSRGGFSKGGRRPQPKRCIGICSMQEEDKKHVFFARFLKVLVKEPLAAGGILLISILLILSLPVNGVQPRFYLSTDKIFSPGEEAFITVESRELTSVDIRVYRIDDASAFFSIQEDAHQPWEPNMSSGVNTLQILGSALDRDMKQWRMFIRRFIYQDHRSGITGKYPGLKKIALPGEKKGKTLHAHVKLLEKYPLVRHFRHQFPENEYGRWVYEQIPIYETDPGVYLVEGVNEKHVGYTLVVISRLALITKQSGDKLLCFVVDKTSGQPVVGADIDILNTNTRKPVTSGKTDKNGLFSTPVKNIPQLTIITKHNKQTAIIDPTFFPVSLDHRKVYIYTERPVYKPDQDVFYKGIVRDFSGEQYKSVMDLPVTVRVKDPKGNQVLEQKTNLNLLGTFNGSFHLDEEPTIGTYKIIAEIQGKSHQGEFKVKEYKKPKFKVDVNLEGSGLNGSKVNAQVHSKYYFGMPVQNASVKYFVYRTRYYVPWWMDEDYSWYYSEAEYRSTRRQLVKSGDGELDTDGRFYFDFETQPDLEDFTYMVEARVKDKSNFTVIGQNSIKTSKGQYNIGIRSNRLIYSVRDKVTVSFYTHDLNNNPVTSGFRFQAVQVLPVTGSGGKEISTREKIIFTRQITTDEKGRTSVSFKTGKSGLIRLVARGVDSFDNVIRSHTTIWVTKDGKPINYSGEGIEIIADKRSYRSGETARFLVLSRIPDIPFLFTVEGGNLYSYQVHKFDGNACLIDLPLKAKYTPNIYVQAAAIFDDHFYLRKKTVIVPPEEKLLKVSLETGKEIYRPGDQVTVEVQVRDYRDRAVQVELSLGVVDESIYALSPELAVEMQKFFYPRKRNNVRTNNSLVFNFYGYSQELKAELARLEFRPDIGLSSFKGSAQSLRQVFKDTCFWTPAVMTSKQGKASITFTLPGNMTQWRLTSRVINWYTQVGTGIKKIIARPDLAIQIDPPQTFTQGDHLVLPVILKNITSSPMEGDFHIQVQGGEISGTFEKKFNIKPNGTAGIPVNIRVFDKEEIVITAAVRAGSFSDSIKQIIPVTPFGVEKVEAVTAFMSPEEKQKTITFTLPGEAFRHFYKAGLYVHAGVYRAVLSSLNYLATYPYGCVEQTMSGFLPDVVLAGVLEKQKASNPELKKKVDEFIASGIARLLSFQNSSGGWGWWDEDSEDAFMTSYVMYGLAMARNLGYRIPDGSFEKGIGALEKILSKPVPDDMRVLCLYVLSLADQAPHSIIMDTYKQWRSLSPYSLGLLALTLEKEGIKQEANSLANALLLKAVRDKGNETLHWQGRVEYRLLSHDAPVESTAFALLALLKIQPQAPEILKAVYWLMNKRTAAHWESTRDTAAVVLALSEFISQKGISEKPGEKLRFRLNNGKWQEIDNETLYSNTADSRVPLPASLLKQGQNQLELENNTGNELFSSLVMSYYSQEQDTKTRSGPLRIHRNYLKIVPAGNQLEAKAFERDEPIVFKPGEEFLVQLDIEPAEQYEYMVLEDFIPAGFQIIEEARGYNFTDSSINENLEHRQVTFKEVRDNRMAFFFSQLETGLPVKVYYLVRAALEGVYQVNPAVIRSMYFNDRRALSRRFKVLVKGE